MAYSISVVQLLQHFTVPANAVLVAIGVKSLTPQAECLEVIYQELHPHRDLMLFYPNFIIQLVHVNLQQFFW